MVECEPENSRPNLNNSENALKQEFIDNLVSVLEIPVLAAGVIFSISGLAECLFENKMLTLLDEFKVNLPEIVKLPVQFFDLLSPIEKFGISSGLMFLGGILHGINNNALLKRKIK